LGVKKEKKLAANLPKSKTEERVKRTDKPAVQQNAKKKPNRIVRYWRSTIGELRKVSWPTRHDAMRLTKIVLMVVLFMAVVLGLLDFLFSRAIALLVTI
jgi:preprotein translocase subunit SecE